MAGKQNAMPPCPVCSSSKHVVGNLSQDLFRCTKCGGMFDLEDDGGTYGDRPDARMIREEERRNRRKRA